MKYTVFLLKPKKHWFSVMVSQNEFYCAYIIHVYFLYKIFVHNKSSLFLNKRTDPFWKSSWTFDFVPVNIRNLQVHDSLMPKYTSLDVQCITWNSKIAWLVTLTDTISWANWWSWVRFLVKQCFLFVFLSLLVSTMAIYFAKVFYLVYYQVCDQL